MTLLDWILGRKPDPPWLQDVLITLDLIEQIVRRLETKMSAQETALNAALAAVAPNTAGVRTGVDTIIAKLEAVDGVDLTEETAALTDLAASLQEAEDKLTAATTEPPPPAEG